jgi:uncharacterized protein
MLLIEKDRASLVALFDEVPYRFEIWAFGSRVNGTAYDTSDLDLVLKTDKNTVIPNPKFRELHTKIRQSNIPFPVELLQRDKIRTYFHTNISKNYEVLYSNIISESKEK